MVEPVTVFLVAIACLLAAAAAVPPLALRTKVPEAVWLVALGAAMRVTGLVPAATIAALAPFFAALALVIVLFEAGRDMAFGSAGEQAGRARKLALVSAGLIVPAVALFSQALSGLELLPTWSWTHALMLAALVLATAPEVFSPSLLTRAHPGVVATLEREAALTGALAIAATAVCIDLLSLAVPEGKAFAAIAAGFGLGLAFGAFAGLLWITAIRRIGPQRGVYPYTLAAILALYVVTDSLGGIGSLAVLVFGAVVANAGLLVATIFKPRGAGKVEAADEDFRDALDDHARTVEITRVLLLTFVGLGLGPPWGLLAMGVVLGLLLVVLRLLAARVVLRGLDERDFSALALGWPRGMLVAGLAALPHAAQVPGTESLTTLVFSAVATTCVAFAVAASHQGQGAADGVVKRTGSSGHVGKDTPGAIPPARPPVAPAPLVEELLAPGRVEVPLPGRTQVPAPLAAEVPVPATSDVLAPTGMPATTPSRTVIAAPPAPVETSVAARTDVSMPLLPDATFSVPSEASAPRLPESPGAALLPEATLSARTVLPEVTTLPDAAAVRTEPRASPLLPDATAPSGALLREATFSVRTEIPVAPAEMPATAPTPVQTDAAASAPVRKNERTILRSSGPGAPELVRHVFVRAADGVLPTSAPTVAAPAIDADALAPPPPPPATVGPSPTPATATKPGPGAMAGPAPERAHAPPLLDFVTEALKTSGQALPTLSEWAVKPRPGEPGAKEE